ncbi:hypothetical protein O181_008311 [Austropuccinia psidii MF-1]|uniref:Integrase catalytic domain-containing protein n=1 Tax=Austropuccinia psidii MF-1 TaxID=1389203 RepID=A0A9Q3GIE3_9BASI|nr:hypothetical protein [Austropuccinia psidii MF-1]
MKALGLAPLDGTTCDICIKGKMTVMPFKGHFDRTSKPIDVLGPISQPSISGHQYILTILDQHTSFKATCFIKSKAAAYEEFVTQKKIVTEGGGKFLDHQLKALANHQGFIQLILPPYMSWHNSFAEQANQTLLDKVRCILLTSNLSSQYWAEAVNSATNISNSVPTPSKNNLSQHFFWTKKTPKIQRLRTFGCKVIFSIPSQKHLWELLYVEEEGIFLG